MNAALPITQALNVFDVADRVVAGGPYARFSQQDQLAVCLFVSGLKPKADEPFRITIVAGAGGDLSVEEKARRMNAARVAAELVLAGRAVPPPDNITLAIGMATGALAAIRAAQKSPDRSVHVLAARHRLYDAVDALTAAFEKEFYNGR